jgi:ketosteroid isomerase-like protein
MSELRRRKSWVLVVILCVLLVAHVLLRLYLPRLQAYSPADSEKAVRKVLDDQVQAWNRGDLDAFMQGYWKSNELRFFSGKDITSGWDATIERYRKRYQAEGREMGKLTFTDLDVKALSPEYAWARGRWRVVKSDETLEGLFTLLFRRMPEGWRIIHDHTSMPTPPPAPPVKKPPEK